MLFELKISTDNAAEFSSFAADFHKFLEKWNSSSAAVQAGHPATNAPASLQFRAPAEQSRIAGDAGAAKSNAAAEREVTRPETESVGNGALPNSFVSPAPPPAISAPETVTPPSPAVSGAEVSEDKPKRTRRTKAEMEALRATSAELPKTNGAGAAGVSTVPSDFTLDDVKSAYNAMCRALGPKSRGVSSEMLLELGVAKFSDLKPEQFGRAIDAMNRKATQPTKTAEAIKDELAF